MATINLFTPSGTLIKTISGTIANDTCSHFGVGLLLSNSANQVQKVDIGTGTVTAGVNTSPHSPVAVAAQRQLISAANPNPYSSNLCYILTEYSV
jgi:hypothetical protein